MNIPSTFAAAILLFTSAAFAKDASSKTPTSPKPPPVPEFNKSDPVAYGRAVADYADRFDSGWKDEYGRNVMTLFDASGDSVRRDSVRIILEKEEGDKSIIRFLAPIEPEASTTNKIKLPVRLRLAFTLRSAAEIGSGAATGRASDSPPAVSLKAAARRVASRAMSVMAPLRA